MSSAEGAAMATSAAMAASMPDERPNENPPTVRPLSDAGGTLAARVYEQLREEIISAKRPAGAELRERDLAAELGVSRVPVRAALPLLEASGLVTITPRRPAVITAITRRDVDELFDMRAALEPGISALAAHTCAQLRLGAESAQGGGFTGSGDERVTALPVTELQTELRAAQEALDADQAGLFDQHSARIHQRIVELASNSLAPKLMTTLEDRVARLNRVSFHQGDATRHAEHAALVHAIVTGNERLAEAVTLTHVESERTRVLQALEHHPHYAGSSPALS